MKRTLIFAVVLLGLCTMGWTLFSDSKTKPAVSKVTPASAICSPGSELAIERRLGSDVPMRGRPETTFSLRLVASLTGFPDTGLPAPGLWDPVPDESSGLIYSIATDFGDCPASVDREIAEAARDPYSHVSLDRQSGLAVELIPTSDGSLAIVRMLDSAGIAISHTKAQSAGRFDSFSLFDMFVCSPSPFVP